MELEVVTRLLELNRVFYQTLGASFSQTRQRLQPGVKGIFSQIPPHSTLLDLGCGNGHIARELNRLGYEGSYVGVDLSMPLLDETRGFNSSTLKTAFIQADITSCSWEESLPIRTFDVVLAFSVFHHIPSKALRLRIYQTLRTMLSDGGAFFHSYWQPLSSSRMRQRIQPWTLVGLKPEDVEEGDYLLDWRHGGFGLRYVHQATPNELREAAEKSGFVVVAEFTSDGENNRLGYYQVWRPGSSIFF